MPRFAANLSLLFVEQPFLERFAAAARRAGIELLLARPDVLGYAGWVGCECLPSGRSEASLAWLARWR